MFFHAFDEPKNGPLRKKKERKNRESREKERRASERKRMQSVLTFLYWLHLSTFFNEKKNCVRKQNFLLAWVIFPPKIRLDFVLLAVKLELASLEKIKTDRDYHLLVMYVFVYLFKCKYLFIALLDLFFLIIIRNTWRHILARSQKFPMWDNTNAIRTLVKSINGTTMLHADSGSILLMWEDVRVSGFTLGLF